MTQDDKVALKEFLTGAAVSIGITAVVLVIIFASSIINLKPEKTPQHTSTVVGSSGDLVCTSSCKVKE